MQTSGDQRRENASSYSIVIVRLVRNCALGRTIQYPRDGNDRPRGLGVLDTPPARGITASRNDLPIHTQSLVGVALKTRYAMRRSLRTTV